MLQIILIALGLSMDAFAASVSQGVCVKELKTWQAFRAAFAFGLFQCVMPILGWLAGSAFFLYIRRFDHWIAVGLLAFIGGRMMAEAFAVKENASCDDFSEAAGSRVAEPVRSDGASSAAKKPPDIRDLRTVFILAVATSIDALAVGISFSALRSPIVMPSIVIGSITFALCLVGLEFGKRIGSRLRLGAEIAGGAVLIAIGVKILIEHLLFGK